MRCQICDYAEGGLPSEYNGGLQDSHALRRVRYNKDTGGSVCDHCISKSKIEWNDEIDDGYVQSLGED